MLVCQLIARPGLAHQVMSDLTHTHTHTRTHTERGGGITTKERMCEAKVSIFRVLLRNGSAENLRQ